MRAIVWNHLQQLRHQPFAIIGMIILTIVFSIAIGQINRSPSIQVPVFTENLTAAESTHLLHRLNESSDIEFKAEDKELVEEKLKKNAIDVALLLEKDSYKLYTKADRPEIPLVEAHVATVLQKEAVLEKTAEQMNASVEELRDDVSASNLFSVSTKSFKENDFVYDNSLQALLGFSLFFVIFSVTFTVSTILDQKMNGMWNRLILSPLTKTQLYLGHLVFSFSLGYAQLVIIFTFFRYVIGVEFYGGYPAVLIAVIPYLFAIVSLGVLISALVTNSRQLDAVIPLIAVSMAMIGGAYWPLEIVQSELLLKLSLAVPMTYGMELLKGATILDWSFSQFFLPAGVLFCMGVVFMGIGLNLMERKAS
jgi:ABC-2 type transport system permease protein